MYVHKTLKIVWFWKPIKTKNLASGLELLSCKLLANPAVVSDVLVLNVHETPSWALSRKEGMGLISSETSAVSLEITLIPVNK